MSNTPDEAMIERFKQYQKFCECHSHGYMCDECENNPEKIKKFILSELKLARQDTLDEVLKKIIRNTNKFTVETPDGSKLTVLLEDIQSLLDNK